MDDRQIQWATYGNLILCFDDWEKDLVELGFAYREDKDFFTYY